MRFLEGKKSVRFQQHPLKLTVKTKQEIAGSIVESLTPQLTNSGQTLLSRLSFTHFAELLEIQDNLKRVFYEVECIRGNWSVRELKRQIATLYYERTGLSRNKKKLASLVERTSEKHLQAVAWRKHIWVCSGFEKIAQLNRKSFQSFD